MRVHVTNVIQQIVSRQKAEILDKATSSLNIQWTLNDPTNKIDRHEVKNKFTSISTFGEHKKSRSYRNWKKKQTGLIKDKDGHQTAKLNQ